MTDILDELNRTHRELGVQQSPHGERRTVLLRRTYDAAIDDVWDAITNAERVGRWLAPVSGDFRLGGTYQLEGNAGGEIVRCEPPSLLKVTWVFGENSATNTSEVEVRLAADGGCTWFELEHLSVDQDPDFWQQYGPGAVGIGWDLMLHGLAEHLAGRMDAAGDEALLHTQEFREFMTNSGRAWQTAHEASGADHAEAAGMADRTIAAYTEESAEAEGTRN